MTGKTAAARMDQQQLSASAAGLPVFTIPEISNYLIKGYWKDFNDWGPRSWADTSISYDVSQLSAERQVLAKMAFAAWDEVCGLEFTEVLGGATADINFVMEPAATAGESAAWETDNAFAGKVISSATIHIAENFDPDTAINSTAYETFIHEIGHALGLGHGGNYNGTGGPGRHYENDTRQFSVMSYGAQGNFNGASSLDVLSPQMADIYSVIRKYGAEAIREGDTVYGNNASGLTAATGHVYDFDAAGFNFNVFGPAFTIVDTGGIDTLDFSKYWADEDGMRIDLRGGRFSDVGQWEGNIGIYLTTVIENAFGGVDSDQMTGNKVTNILDGGMGEDILNGLGGNDILTGGGDADTFRFGRKGKADYITDFEDTVDVIDLSGMDFSRFSKVLKLAKDVGTDLVIEFGKGDQLTIGGFSKAEFDAADVLI